MAHMKFFNSEYSQVTGSIKRAQQLVSRELDNVAAQPHRATKSYRQLQSIARRLDEMGQQHPTQVRMEKVQHALHDLSFILKDLQLAS